MSGASKRRVMATEIADCSQFRRHGSTLGSGGNIYERTQTLGSLAGQIYENLRFFSRKSLDSRTQVCSAK
jgi:hypothetical protein